MAFLQSKKKAASLRIIIVGCGKVGHTLAQRLSEEGHSITVVDTNERAMKDVTEQLDIMGICGNGAVLHVLDEAGLSQSDMVIAVTGSDELNLLCCIVARKAGNDLAAIARVRNPDYGAEIPYLRQQLGLSMIINPELEAAKEIARVISRPQALTVSSFAKAQAELVRFRIPEHNVLCGRNLKQMSSMMPVSFLACAVVRSGEVYIPDGSFTLMPEDELSILASVKDIRRIFSTIGMYGEAARTCMIIGGGKSSYYLARLLIAQRVRVKIIEANPKRCQELTTLLPEAVILQGDGSDEALLREEGIEDIDAFVALTGMDEENILLTLFANRFQGVKTITKVNRINFNDVIDNLQLGSVVYPKYITAEAILAYVRARQNSIGSNVETLYRMFDNRVEAIEFHVEKDSPVIGIPLMEMKLKDHLLIACIGRSNRVFFPRGGDSIQAGDHVVIVTTHTGFADISDILA